jgi:hypothetical protein
MTPDQITKAKALGQQVFDLLHDRCEAENIYEFDIVMNVLISIVAHFMAGIDDEALRAAAYMKFGGNLLGHIEHLREERPDLVAQIVLKGKMQ